MSPPSLHPHDLDAPTEQRSTGAPLSPPQLACGVTQSTVPAYSAWTAFGHSTAVSSLPRRGNSSS